MKLKSILTSRDYMKFAFWQIVYEWEDDFSAYLSLDVINMCSQLFCYGITTKKWCRRLLRRIPPMKRLLLPSGYKLLIEMQPFLPESPSQFEDYGNKIDAERIIPYIIDCEFSEKDVSLFDENYRVYPLVLISSKKSYDVLKNHLLRNVRIAHLPLCISDRYNVSENTKFEKCFDVALFGRQDPLLVGFFERYYLSRPGISVISRKMVNDVYSYVTNEGEVIGEVDDRSCFLELLSKVRVVFYSTSHRYPEYKLTEDFVTPKWLEYIACGCHIIANYPKNSDTDYYTMDTIAPSISTYEEFENAMDYALAHEVDMVKYSNYLAKHYTSVRAKELREIVSKL